MKTSGRKCDLLLFLVFLVAAAIRTLAVATRDLPTGDEVNCYIAQAQAFADHGRIAALSDHPGVSIIYGALIVAIRSVHSTLDGIVAANLVMWMSGVIAPCLLYLALRRLYGRLAAFLAGILLSVFPGCYLVFRGDLSLYALFLAALILSLSRLVAQPSPWRAVSMGVLGGCLYLCRSDGLYVVALTVGLAAFAFPAIGRHALLSLAAFFLVVGLFFSARYLVMHDFGTGTSTRAFDAFYQAEGLNDGKGGSWQDFTARGLERFGPPARYGGSMMRLLLSNTEALGQRARHNLALIGGYTRSSVGRPGLWFLTMGVGCLLTRRAIKTALVAALPCLITSLIYLLFYFQESYFVMQSFGLMVACGVGLAVLLEYLMTRLRLRRHLAEVTVVAGVLLTAWFGCRTCVPLARMAGTTISSRCWDALVVLKKDVVDNGGAFFAYPYAGSRAMYVYTDGGEPDLADSDVRGKAAGAVAGLLKAHHVEFVLACREQDLWELSSSASTAYSNTRDDVRIYKLRN